VQQQVNNQGGLQREAAICPTSAAPALLQAHGSSSSSSNILLLLLLLLLLLVMATIPRRGQQEVGMPLLHLSLQPQPSAQVCCTPCHH
jgi:hypothetical protein